MIRPSVVVLLVLVGAGCVVTGPVRAPIAATPEVWTLPAVLPTEIGFSLDPRFSSEEVADLAWSMRAWEDATAGCVQFRAFGDDIAIVRAADRAELPPGIRPTSIAAWSPDTARLTVAPSTFCGAGVCTLARRDVFVHELGHVLGLEHGATPASCMTELLQWGCSDRAGGVPAVDARSWCAAHPSCRCAQEWP